MPSPGSASLLSITVTTPNATVLAGSTLRIDYTVDATDSVNCSSSLRLYPYYSSSQFGAEVGLLSCPSSGQGGGGAGHAYLPVPWGISGAVPFVLAWHAAPTGPTVGREWPAGALTSAPLVLTVVPRAPARPFPVPALAAVNSTSLFSLYIETWFTPLNFFWQGGPGLAEAIPLAGRYASVDLPAIVHHAATFVQAAVDVVVVDWTNNAWDTPTWGARNPNIQELVNATNLYVGVFAGLKAQGWDVPKFLLLLGLSNGPTTPLPALMGELDYIVEAYLANATVGPDLFVSYLGKPLVVIFDGTGADHSAFTHPNFTVRWMSSQNQQSRFNDNGYWSWMDGTISPLLTPFDGGVESATAAPAYFAGGGWTDTSTAMGRSGGLTLVETCAHILEGSVGRGLGNVTFANVCQFNEYAGQANGSPSYADSYSADLSNDVEATGPFACGYGRPGRTCGGWGWRAMNLLTMMGHAFRAPQLLDDALLVSVLSPAVGDVSNYTSPGATTVSITFVLTAFSSQSLLSGSSFAMNVSRPVQLAVDGTAVGTAVPASSPAGSPVTVTLDVATAGPGGAPLDRSFPHIVTLTAQESSPGAGDNLTSYPCSFDVFDEGAPLTGQRRSAAVATVWIRLPEAAAAERAA